MREKDLSDLSEALISVRSALRELGDTAPEITIALRHDAYTEFRHRASGADIETRRDGSGYYSGVLFQLRRESYERG